MEPQKLTVLIPAGNEEKNLPDCVKSVTFADEILVVVDEASTDGTLELARKLAHTVLVHPYENSAAQKNWAIPQAKHPWILVVDADERVTPELAEEIRQVLLFDGPFNGYKIRRVNHFMGQRIKGCGWQRDKVLRLFRRDMGKYQERHVHADIEFPEGEEKIGQLHHPFLHFTYDTFDHYLKKHARYAVWAGKDRALTTKKIGYRHLIFRPLARFLRQYIFFAGWRDGLVGFIICWMAAHSVFLKYVHALEIQKRGKSD